MMDEKNLYTTEAAISSGDVNTLKVLFSNGVDPNQRDSEIDSTLLHKAVFRKQVEIAKVLIENGAEINAKDRYGETPLHLALSLSPDDDLVNLVKIVNLLIYQGADIETRDKLGKTPAYTFESSLRHFLKEISDASRVNSTILHIVKLLRDNGADCDEQSINNLLKSRRKRIYIRSGWIRRVMRRMKH